VSPAYLPQLPAGWAETRATLHAYAHSVGAIPRAHAVAHPRWWHVGLKVRPGGLATDAVPLPGGGALGLTMDLANHTIRVRASDGGQKSYSMTEGVTGTDLADRLIADAAEHGLGGEYNREKFENDQPRQYRPDAAEAFWTALVNVNTVFERHRLGLGERVGPVNLWPHNFDLSTEWFGTRVEEYEEEGKVTAQPAQLNLGFYPDEAEPYFYSNPWPFDEKLVGEPLPAGAEWHTGAWQGTILPYSRLQGRDDAAEILAGYARGVFELVSPTLMA
jgi:hypothetical protein